MATIRLILILFILVVFQDFGTGRPYFKRQSEDDEFGKKIDAFYYLSQFGYIDKDDENSEFLTDDVISNAVAEFQVKIR